ncbi:MAG TPA: HEAT repeat domain-containing protein [Fimbriimonadaceae bacterium]|jgi:HEAT repeat protein
MKTEESFINNISSLAVKRDPILREEAIDTILDIGNRTCARQGMVELRRIVRKLTSDRNEMVRMKATEALGVLGNSRDLQLLSRLALDKAWTVRSSAYASLAVLGHRRAILVITKGFHDSHPVVRKYAAVAAYDLIGCDAVPLVKAVESRYRSLEARVGFLLVLSACGDLPSRVELELMAKGPDKRLASSAASALEDSDAPYRKS